MKSMLSGFLGSQVHHRRAERGVSITLPSLRQSNFGKLQFGFVLADFQISPTLKLYFWALFRPALHKMSQIKWCHVKINNPEKNISLLLWQVLTPFFLRKSYHAVSFVCIDTLVSIWVNPQFYCIAVYYRHKGFEHQKVNKKA